MRLSRVEDTDLALCPVPPHWSSVTLNDHFTFLSLFFHFKVELSNNTYFMRVPELKIVLIVPKNAQKSYSSIPYSLKFS